MIKKIIDTNIYIDLFLNPDLYEDIFLSEGTIYLSSVVDSIYGTRSLYEMLIKERESHQKVWQNRYMHYRTIHDNVSRLELMTSNILKGLPTKEALASLKLKQLPPPETGR